MLSPDAPRARKSPRPLTSRQRRPALGSQGSAGHAAASGPRAVISRSIRDLVCACFCPETPHSVRVSDSRTRSAPPAATPAPPPPRPSKARGSAPGLPGARRRASPAPAGRSEQRTAQKRGRRAGKRPRQRPVSSGRPEQECRGRPTPAASLGVRALGRPRACCSAQSPTHHGGAPECGSGVQYVRGCWQRQNRGLGCRRTNCSDQQREDRRFGAGSGRDQTERRCGGFPGVPRPHTRSASPTLCTPAGGPRVSRRPESPDLPPVHLPSLPPCLPNLGQAHFIKTK